AQLLDAFGGVAAQDVDQVAGAEALAAAVDRRQRLLRRLGAVPDPGRGDAVVAVAAGPAFLAEIAEQAHAPATGGLGQADQRVELAVGEALVIVLGLGLVDHASLLHHVLQAVGHPGVGGGAVAPGAAGLLIIGLDRLGQVEVGDKAHVGLVD